MKLPCRFGYSEMLPIPKILIKVIRELPAFEVVNFPSSDFLKNLQNLPGIKFGAAIEYNAKALFILLLDFLILIYSYIYQKSSELVYRRYDSQNTLK